MMNSLLTSYIVQINQQTKHEHGEIEIQEKKKIISIL